MLAVFFASQEEAEYVLELLHCVPSISIVSKPLNENDSKCGVISTKYLLGLTWVGSSTSFSSNFF